MKIKVLIGIFCFCMQTQLYAKQDSVIMTIGGRDVSLKEFVYMANKNNEVDFKDKVSLDNYITLYKNFKLKVIAAEELGMDTTQSFKNEFEGYKSQLVNNYLIDKNIEQEVLKDFTNRFENILSVEGICVHLPKASFPSDTLEAFNEIQKIYSQIQNKNDIAVIGQDLQNKDSINVAYFAIKDFVPFKVQKGIEDVVYSLSVNQTSKPFRTEDGYYIVSIKDIYANSGEADTEKIWHKLMEKNMIPELINKEEQQHLKDYNYILSIDSYNELVEGSKINFPTDDEFYNKFSNKKKSLFKLDGKEYTQADFINFIRSYHNSRNHYCEDYLRDELLLYLDGLCKKLVIADIPNKYLDYELILNEYREGMLLFEISNNMIWSKPLNEQADLEQSWIKELENKYPVTINWKLMKKINK